MAEQSVRPNAKPTVTPALKNGDIREMAITASHLKIAIRGTYLGQEVQVIQWYRPTGAAFLTASPEGVGEAYWNDIKDDWRAFMWNGPSQKTESIFVSEPGSTGAYGEYPIPLAEQEGVRTGASGGNFMPPFIASGVRLTVGTRATRPGQKRFWTMVEGDNVDGVLQPSIVGPLTTLAAKFSSVITLGAPVATGTLTPEIVRINRVTGAIDAAQDVTGFLINPQATSQNSRKVGRGS